MEAERFLTVNADHSAIHYYVTNMTQEDRDRFIRLISQRHLLSTGIPLEVLEKETLEDPQWRTDLLKRDIKGQLTQVVTKRRTDCPFSALSAAEWRGETPPA